LKKHRRAAPLGSLLAARAIGVLLLGFGLAACAKRPPILVPPASGVEAVEGYGSASVQGEEAVVKGKFAFLFRRPGFGRVEAFDPFGRTIYYMIFESGRAYLVFPSKKVYTEDLPEVMIGRFLGFSLRPDEVLEVVSGQWSTAVAGDASGLGSTWALEKDASGRVARGEKNGVSFRVGEFFPGGGVPRTVLFSRPGTSGRVKILSLRFNPAPRPEAFETTFLRVFVRKSWEEIEGMARDGR
jgi:hypothetical protein